MITIGNRSRALLCQLVIRNDSSSTVVSHKPAANCPPPAGVRTVHGVPLRGGVPVCGGGSLSDPGAAVGQRGPLQQHHRAL